MKLSGSGRFVLACSVSVALGLGISSCGGGTIAYLWVLEGKTAANSAGNTITGYKVDNNSGNLTEIVHSPFTSGGTNPVMGVVRPGGRYVYVLNAGDAQNSVAEFSVGGDGVLTFQQAFASQGGTPQWMDISTGGDYLYVLDQVSPNTTTACTTATGLLPKTACGSITVFGIDPDTGRLTLVQNQSIKNNGTFLTYTPTGPAPYRIKTTSSGVIVVVNGDQTITTLQVGTAGQLTVNANSTQIIDSPPTIDNITSITTGGSYLYLTDGANNRILQYTVSSTGVLQPVTGGQVANLVPNVTPVWTLTDSSSTKLYVLNQNTTSGTSPKSSISGFTIQTNGNLTAQSTNLNPYAVGSGPVCMVEDPSRQWVYTSNQDGTVTGYHINHVEGTLNALTRGSTFQAQGKPACLIISGITS
ncbi:MAG: beta-propeller fold lactonase family protein [Janthinobacterium lividum]